MTVVYFDATPTLPVAPVQEPAAPLAPVAQDAQQMAALTGLANSDTAPGGMDDNYIALDTLRGLSTESFWALPESVRDWVRSVETADWQAQATGDIRPLQALGFDNSSGAFYCQLSTAHDLTLGGGTPAPAAPTLADYTRYRETLADSAAFQQPDRSGLPG